MSPNKYLAILMAGMVPFNAISSSHFQYSINNGLYMEKDFRQINDISNHIQDSHQFLCLPEVNLLCSTNP